MLSSKDEFLSLVRWGIGHEFYPPPRTVDWDEIQALANKQGLSAVVLDGVEALRNSTIAFELPEKRTLTQWIGEVLQGYEHRYELYRRAIAEIAGFYNSHGYKMMVMKGYACSLDWPKPEHRPTGDIDIWLFGHQKTADALMEKEKGVIIDLSFASDLRRQL